MRRTLSAGLGARRAQRTPRLSRAAAMIGGRRSLHSGCTGDSAGNLKGAGGRVALAEAGPAAGRVCRAAARPAAQSASRPPRLRRRGSEPAFAAPQDGTRAARDPPRRLARFPVCGARGPGGGARAARGRRPWGVRAPHCHLARRGHVPLTRRGAAHMSLTRRAAPSPPPSEICVPRLVPPSAPGAPGPTRFITPGGRPGQHFTTSPGSDVAGARRGVPPVIRMFPRRIDCF